MQNITVAEYIASFCKAKDLSTIYHYIGGMTTHLVDAIAQNDSLKLITLRTEQAAGFAANAHARITNKPIISLATSGPGATNLVTPIADCYFDYVPAIFICGQVNTFEQCPTPHIRQLGFQETDIVNIVKPITKLTLAVKQAQDIPNILEKAYNVALTTPYGPVLLDIPMNIQMQKCSLAPFVKKNVEQEKKNNDNTLQLKQFQIDIEQALRPLVLFGHGVQLDQAVNICHEFIEKFNLPVVHSLHGLDSAPSRLNYGFIGSYGNRYANLALAQSDFLLVLGSRLDIRQTGADTAYFERSKKIYHVDINNAQFNTRTAHAIGIKTNIKHFIKKILHLPLKLHNTQSWLDNLDKYKKNYPFDQEIILNDNSIHPNILLRKLSHLFTETVGYTIDVGKNQMYAAQSLQPKIGERVIFSGGLGAMGFSLPAAIGMAFATNNTVICITGDGGLQMNIQELQTIIHYKLNIKIIVLQNHSLGMVQQFQEDYFENRLFATNWDYSSPDFFKIAQGYGISAKKITKQSEIENALLWVKSSKGPCLLECVIPNTTKLYPKIFYGNNLENMFPFVEN